jgi:hypothetical protein
MFGTYQSSALRIEVDATETHLRASLTETEPLKQWLWPQRLSAGIPGTLQSGTTFSSWTGPLEIQHYVDVVSPHSIRLILSRGIDGFHEWSWGDGWVQSRLEGITLLPLNLGQTLTLARLQLFLKQAQS